MKLKTQNSKLKTILFAFVVGCWMLDVGCSYSQVPATTNAPEAKAAILSFVQGVGTAKAVTVAIYPSYAPDIAKGNIGFGVAALYPIAPDSTGGHLFTGLRGDFLGGTFFAATASAGLKADFQLFGHNFTPFAITGAIIPLSGGGKINGQVGLIAGGGITTTIWASADKKYVINLFAEAEHVSLFHGPIYHGGATLTVHF